ncbi:MAG: lysophospholipase [Paraclostridium sp.]
MIKSNFTYKGEENIDVYVYKYTPKDDKAIKAVVQISHGMSEEASRYERFAEKLTKNGYIVYINDHRGHGKTAKDINKVGILANKDSILCVVKDLKKLTDIIKAKHTGLPVFLFSHSMGSFAAQRYIIEHSNEIDGVILSGTNGSHGLEVDMGLVVAKLICLIKGREKKAYLIDKLAFGSFNNKFDKKTNFDWLSADEEEVKKYIENPYCGVVFSNGFFYDLFSNFKYIRKNQNMAKINKNLPIYIFSGDKDPVGKFGKGVNKLYENYKAVGIENIQCKLYEEGRHEMLNEINKEEVIKDVIEWLECINKYNFAQ